MKLGIVGNGVVGRATHTCFAEGNDVRVYDAAPERSTHSLRDVLDCHLVFVCLPTPQKSGSLECDTSVLDEFFAGTSEANFVLRSTVPIGYTRLARIVHCIRSTTHWPDFHTERYGDAASPDKLVVGEPEHQPCLPLLELLRDRWPDVPLHRMSSDESEAVKLMQNARSAVNVALANEFRKGCSQYGLDWARVHGALGGPTVPGPDGQPGFGGACLPKDTANLIHCLGDARVCRAALDRNYGDRL